MRCLTPLKGEMVGSTTFASDLVRGFSMGPLRKLWHAWPVLGNVEGKISVLLQSWQRQSGPGQQDWGDRVGWRRTLQDRKSEVYLGSSQEEPPELRMEGCISQGCRKSLSWLLEERNICLEEGNSQWRVSRETPRSPQELSEKNDQLQASARAEKTELVLLPSKQDFLCPYSPPLPLLTVKPRAWSQARDPSEWEPRAHRMMPALALRDLSH